MNSLKNRQKENSTESVVESQKAGPVKRAHWLKSLSITLLMVPIWFLIFEGALRLVGYEPPTPSHLMAFINPEWVDKNLFQLDPDLFWRFRPNQMLEGNSKEYGNYSIRINNLGFRGPDFPDPRAEGAVRLMFLGDSCVFGWDAPAGKNFPRQLINFLEKKYPAQDFHAFTGAVPGYSSFQARKILDLYGKAYQPDLVLVYLGTNDALPCVDYPDEEMMSRMKEEFKKQSFLQSSRLYLLAEQMLLQPNEDQISPNELSRQLDHKNGPFRVSLEAFERNLRLISEISRKQPGAEVLFLTRQDLRKNPRVLLYNERVRKLGQDLKVPVVEVARWFASRPEPELFYAHPQRDKIHPNAKGYKAIARLTFETIQEKRLIPVEEPRLDASRD